MPHVICVIKDLNGTHQLLRLGEADCITPEVVDSEILAEEDVSNNPKGTSREVDVEAGERADASALDLKDVVTALEWICLAIEEEVEIREIGHLTAIDSVLPVPRFLGTDPRKQL